MSDENLSNCLVIASRSDAGMVRTHNEDAVFVSASSGLIVLADGMGVYNAGEVAAGMAISLLGGELEPLLPCFPNEGCAGRERRGQASCGEGEAEAQRGGSGPWHGGNLSDRGGGSRARCG